LEPPSGGVCAAAEGFNPRHGRKGCWIMVQSKVRQYIHCVFSTKNREPWISTDLEDVLYPLLARIAQKRDSMILGVGGIENHIHVLLSLSPTISLSQMIQYLKGTSSYWIRRNHPEIDYFHWQDGYGAFSIGISNLEKTRKYIQKQKEHHQNVSFEQEYEVILKKHDLLIDDLVWM
ncbi:MAG TPA: IS200/IS605 family transposase, partial [bacterium]|nr:IS200/IS605 family transposase [bacterium]